MNDLPWTVTFRIYRKKTGQPPHFDTFPLPVSPDEYVLDGIERIWAFHDRSLAFRHACHHSTCGACGMRVNGVEKLTCITRIGDVTHDGGTLQIEPLRNFPIVSDLSVDVAPFFRAMDATGYLALTPLADAPKSDVAAAGGIRPMGKDAEGEFERLNDCIECGCCISACPIGTTTPDYLGPGVMAAIQSRGAAELPSLLAMADSEDGIWRCHSAYECEAVCPSFVDPARRIMNLRSQVVGHRLRTLFSR
jgi:succinate dehydrogenase/fumarate reductase iron-sulfur protein